MILSLSLLAFSCKKATISDAEYTTIEADNLQKYLLSHHITVSPTSSGLYYLPTDTGNGIKPIISDVIIFTYSLRLENDSVIATNIDSVAKRHNLFTEGLFYIPFEYRLKWWFTGMQEGFQLMHESGKASFILPSQLAYGKNGYPSLNVPAFTTIIVDVELIKVIHDPVAYEKTQMDKFVTDSIPAGKVNEVLDSGVYHIIDTAGTGALPVNSNVVDVIYSASLLNGMVVTGKTPYSYTLGATSIIAGFDQGIRRMKKGEYAWVIIPYSQGFGEQAAYPINLPPFTTLVYYIHVVNIR